MTPTQKDLIDTDGENRAVRAFLLGREVGCKDYEQMRRHMTNSGFNNCWPSEFAGLGGHMSKGDQQMWLRHLFALERLGALAEQPAEKEPFKPDWDRVEALRESLREHMADVRQLRAALAWIASHKNSDWSERCQQIVDKARAALAEQPAEQKPEGSVCGRCGGLVFDPVLPQPAKREPLTRDQVKELMKPDYDTASMQERADFMTGFRAAERAHGITKE